MKKIEAIVPPSKVREIRRALRESRVEDITVVQVTGQGREEDKFEIYRGSEYDASLRHHSKVEVVVSDRDASQVIAVIFQAAHTGKPGDGKIFVSEVLEAIRISKAQRDEAAL
jgi:nitrogen regulatory protein P-II 1